MRIDRSEHGEPISGGFWGGRNVVDGLLPSRSFQPGFTLWQSREEMEEARLASYWMRLLKLNTISTYHLRTEKHFIGAHNRWRSKKKKSQYCNFIRNPLFFPSGQVKALQPPMRPRCLMASSYTHAFMCSGVHPSTHPVIHSTNKPSIVFLTLGKEVTSYYI